MNIQKQEETMTEKEKETEIKKITSWDDIVGLNTDILRGIYAYGFEKPSPIQSTAILPLIKGEDLIAQAQSGTGKTGSFTIGALSKIDLTQNWCQVLILAPTHELVYQIAQVVSKIGALMTGLKIKTIVGGSSIDGDVRDMRANPPHIIVGCTGRVFDMIRRRHIDPFKLKLVILDEADEMLSNGFKEQVQSIFQRLNTKTQIALFSATLNQHVFDLTKLFMYNPTKICVKAESLTLEGIKQYFIALNDDREKYDVLKDLYQHVTVAQCIIYVNSIKRVIDLYESMKSDGFPVCCIHSNMTRMERDQVFKEFRTGSARVLISSNITSRGIDIQQVNVVINFDIPRDVYTYLHRIGRSGRWGRKGTGINFITRRDIFKIKEIEQYYNTQIEELPSSFSV